MPAQPIPGKSFIEVQFPVSKISKESYKERTAAQSQTLSRLGKWWGRKPLILCRAAILGLLLPATDNPIKDRETFLKLLTMDMEGIWRRKNKNIPLKELIRLLTLSEQNEYLELDRVSGKFKLKVEISRERREELQNIVFSRMSYDEKIEYCKRPEQIDGPSPATWDEINNHLGTHASSLQELVHELGRLQYGTIPIVGDCFCGGGNIPFEAARLGCNIYASDLNPVATLLTWAALNILGGEKEIIIKIKEAQEEVFSKVEQQINDWGIEQNEKGWRAFAYLYCSEVKCPECGWHVPLLTTLVIAERMQKVIAELIPDSINQRFEIRVRTGVPAEEIEDAKRSGTIINSQLKCPNPNCTGHIAPISLEAIRGEGNGGLRHWSKEDIVPQHDDVFNERLYCIRWEEKYWDDHGHEQIKWHFLEPTNYDLDNEKRTFFFLKERFDAWQRNGFLPNSIIEEGDETSRLTRERGWTYWHHLFTPRQLLYHGLLLESGFKEFHNRSEQIIILLSLDKCLDYNSKLAGWNSSHDKSTPTFYNQALNTLNVFTCRGMSYLKISWFFELEYSQISNNLQIFPKDARSIDYDSNFWITDPPYADAINYHELSEYFLAWLKKPLNLLFPDWQIDSKRALAIRGTGIEFRKGMIETYQNLVDHTIANGIQIVMFTHQNVDVWADLALILWTSGLHVTAAWCISTETTSALRKGNYVQGTVLLILRKQTSQETAFLDEIYPEVESEVRHQLDTMLELDKKDDPNFGDTDYQLAAYAAALRVLTKYKKIEEIDVEREIARVRQNGEKSPLEIVIETAVKIACDHLIPLGIDSFLWKQLGPEERFYLKGLELESHGEYRIGAYQELARGFGIRSYRDMQESGRANETRLRTASEFKDRFLRDEGFGLSLVRQVLFAVRQTMQENDTVAGKAWLRGLPNYWDRRKDIIGILIYLATIGTSDTMPQWHDDAKASRLLAGAVEQDHV